MKFSILNKLWLQYQGFVDHELYTMAIGYWTFIEIMATNGLKFKEYLKIQEEKVAYAFKFTPTFHKTNDEMKDQILSLETNQQLNPELVMLFYFIYNSNSIEIVNEHKTHIIIRFPK